MLLLNKKEDCKKKLIRRVFDFLFDVAQTWKVDFSKMKSWVTQNRELPLKRYMYESTKYLAIIFNILYLFESSFQWKKKLVISTPLLQENSVLARRHKSVRRSTRFWGQTSKFYSSQYGSFFNVYFGFIVLQKV